jgi:SAM-dependent methyltransferase
MRSNTRTEQEGPSKDYLEKRLANNTYWAQRAHQHGRGLAATAATEWIRRSTLRRLRRFIKPSDLVLEVGCGNASSLLAPLSCHCQAYGVDLTMEMLLVANRYRPAIKGLTRSDACYLPFRDATFDLVYTSRCLINVPLHDMQQLALRELCRVVKPTGTVVLTENFDEPVASLNRAKARYKAGPPETDEQNLRLNLSTTIEHLRQQGWKPVWVRGNTLASFVHHVIAGKITRHGGSRIVERLLHPIYGGLCFLEDSFGGQLPLFGKDTTVVLARQSS